MVARIFWTPDKNQFMRKNYGVMTARAIADQLGATRSAVKTQAYKLGLTAEMTPEMYSENGRKGGLIRQGKASA